MPPMRPPMQQPPSIFSTQDLAQQDPSNNAESASLFQTAQMPPFQGGQPRIMPSMGAAQMGGQQPVQDSIAQGLFNSKQMTPDNMKIPHSTAPGAASVNTMAQSGLNQSVNAATTPTIGTQAPGIPSPDEIAYRKLFTLPGQKQL